MIAATVLSAALAPHVVFVIGDHEYRSEESMPMLAQMVQKEFGYRTSICASRNRKGQFDPNNVGSINDLEALKTADLAIFFMRFRKLPDWQLKIITDYIDSGKPAIGFRTSTHLFQYGEGSEFDFEWPKRVFGQGWITHHGHFGDNNEFLTDVTVADNEHEIMSGLEPFQSFSWLYHVIGPQDTMGENCTPLMTGKALKTGHGETHERFPITNPVAWTKFNGEQRVFFTTLGHPYDFKDVNMRRLTMNAILWSLREPVPEGGTKAELPGPYDPSPSGFIKD